MSDYGHNETDKELKDLEKRLAKEYRDATKDLEKKFEGFMKDFARKDEEMKKLLDSGKIDEKGYLDWRRNQLIIGERWKDMYDTLAKDLANVDQIAAGMINETLSSVYALNMNYGTYEVESGCRIDTGFNLYSRETVENMMKNEPNIIPKLSEKQKKKIKEDELWNRKKLVSAMTQGILQGESIPKIAERLGRVANMDYNASIRNARTYTTAAQNKGRMDSYERMDKLGIQVKKKWIATLDERTRMEHRHLDGMVVPYNDLFRVDGYEIMFPGDPDCEEPGMIYNCRCTLVSEIPGIQYDDERYDEKLGGMSYEEWKNAKGEPKEEVKEEKTKVSWIDRIKEIQSKENLTEGDVKEAGKIISEQVHSGYLDDLKKEKEEHEKEVKIAKERYDRALENVREIQNSPEFKEAAQIKSGWIKIEDSYYFNSVDDAVAYYQEKFEELSELQEIRKADFDYWYKLMGESTAFDYDKSADLLVGILSQVREMGIPADVDIVKHLSNSRSPVRKNIEWAYRRYPTSWIRKSVESGELSVKKASRGFYSHWRSLIAISGDNPAGMNKTAVHELGHRFERSIPGLKDKEKEFYERRTAGEKLVWLGSGYGKDEKTRKDDFMDAYMGKDYGGTAYELVSMGFQHAYTNPVRLSQDEDMEEWIYGLLAVVGE